MSTRRKERRSRQRSRRCTKTSPPFARKDTKRKRKKEKRERERERERERIKQLRSGTRIGSIHHRQIRARRLERRKKLEKRPRRRTCTASLVVTGDVVAISSRLFPRAQHERKDGDKDQQTPVGTNFEDAGIGTRHPIRRLFCSFFIFFLFMLCLYTLSSKRTTYVYLLHALALTSLRLHPVRRRRRRRRRRRQRRSDFPRI